MNQKPTVSIVGFGRFGKVLYRLMKDDFAITLYSRNSAAFDGLDTPDTVTTTTTKSDIYKSDVVFFSVPISSFESVIESHKKYFDDQLLVDVLSVKVHPKNVFDKHLAGTNTRALLTHPIFCPDISKGGFG